MKIANSKLMKLLEQAMNEMIKGESDSDSFQSSLFGYSSEFANRMSRDILIAAETLAYTMNSLQKLWNGIDGTNKIKTFTAFLNKVAEKKFEMIRKSLDDFGRKNFKQDLRRLQNEAPELLRVRQEILNFTGYTDTEAERTVEGQFTKLYKLLTNLETTIRKRNEKSPQKLNNAQIEKIVFTNGERLISSLFDFIPSVNNLVNQARSTFQRIKPQQNKINTPSSALFPKKNKKESSEVFEILKKLDNIVINYYNSIETLFHSFASIGTTLKYKDLDAAKELLNIQPKREEEDDDSTSLAMDPRWKKKNQQRTQSAFFKKNIDDLLGRKETENNDYVFDKDAFLAFFFKTNQNYRPEEFPVEYKKSKIIQSLFRQTKELETRIGTLFANPSTPNVDQSNMRSSYMKNKYEQRNTSEFGLFNAVLFDNKRNKYIFPEIAPMFKNMMKVKLLYKSRFNELLSRLESFHGQFPTRDSTFNSYKTPMVNYLEVNPVYEKYKDLKDFFDNESEQIQYFIKLIQFSKVEFKGLINKMLTGSGLQDRDEMQTMVNQIHSQSQDKMDKRQRYFHLFKNLGWLPKNAGEEMPSWLYTSAPNNEDV